MQAYRGDPRALGVVYTPPELTEPMVRRALAPLIHGKSIDDLAALRICDPAAGEGAFLLAVIRVMTEALLDAGAPPDDAARIAPACACGVELDDTALSAARTAVPGGALIVGDALALDWPSAFPDVFARGGFDAIVGNPPYVRQEHFSARKPQLRSFASYDGVADLYVYFVELTHRLLRAGGRYCLVTPNKWLTAAYGRALRRYLADQGSVEGVVDLGRSTLFGADAFPCIVWGTRRAQPPDDLESIAAARIAPDAPLVLAGAPHDRARWAEAPWHIDAPDDAALLERLAAQWPSLAEVVPMSPARGVVTGCNRAFVIDAATRAKLLEAEPAAAPLIRPFLKGRDVRGYRPAPTTRWLLLIDRGVSLDELPHTLAHLAQFRALLEPRDRDAPATADGRKPGAYRWYELQDPVGALIRARAPRLLYQDIQTSPVCALDVDGDCVPDTTVWMLPSADPFLLALLNSPLYFWYAQRRFPPALNGSVRPKAAHLRHLPIASPSPALRDEIEALVAQRLAAADTDSAETTAARDLDRAIHDALMRAYELAPAERALIAARR